MSNLAAFLEERNAMLLAGDVDRMIAFHSKWNPTSPAFPNREVAEASLHKARTAVLALPIEERLKSHRWLLERGYSSFHDGDLHG